MGNLVVLDERPPYQVAAVQQIHSNLIVDLRSGPPGPLPANADGMIAAADLSRALAIVTADCVPIAVAGRDAVAMIHAGWRGLWQNILAAPALAAIDPHYFFLGPHIRPCCYQVGAEFVQYFPQQLPSSGPFFLDLALVARQQIKHLYPHAQLEQAEECTCCHPLGFHSYRRTKNNCRNWNLLLPSH